MEFLLNENHAAFIGKRVRIDILGVGETEAEIVGTEQYGFIAKLPDGKRVSCTWNRLLRKGLTSVS